MRRPVMLVVLAAVVVSTIVLARQSPPQYKVWVMQPLRCADLTIPDTTLIRICLDSSSFRGRAGPLLHAALQQGVDSSVVARLAESATDKTYKRAANTNALQDYREAVALGRGYRAGHHAHHAWDPE